MLISMKEMLSPTRQHRFAIGAFNVADSCFIRAVVEEAEATQTPAIISIHPSELAFVTDAFFGYVRERTLKSTVPLPCIWIMVLRLPTCCALFSVALHRS